MKIFHFIKKIFSKTKSKEDVELKYFKKYARLVHPYVYNSLLEQYRDGPIIFEPIRNKLSEKELDKMYIKIDKSDFLTHQEKFETIIALMYLIDGSFPENDKIMFRFQKIFGKYFVEMIEEKRKEFKDVIINKKLISYIKSKSFSPRRN